MCILINMYSKITKVIHDSSRYLLNLMRGVARSNSLDNPNPYLLVPTIYPSNVQRPVTNKPVDNR